MKKVILFLLFVLSFSFVRSQTTLEEYQYITKQYQKDRSYGLDVKEGYKFENIQTIIYMLNGVERRFNFKKFIRTDTNEMAAVMVEYIRVSKGKFYTIYFCIPRADSSDKIWQVVRDTLEQFATEDVKTAYNWALTKYVASTF